MLVFENNKAVLNYALLYLNGVSLSDDYRGGYISEEETTHMLKTLSSLQHVSKMSLIAYKQMEDDAPNKNVE